MSGKIPTGRIGLVAVVVAIAALTISAAASALPLTVVYNNFNTVPATVNSHPNEDTYSAAPFEFPFGGMVEFSHRPGTIKSMTAQVDSFTCEHGVYDLENCYTGRPGKKFGYELSARIYEVGAGNAPGNVVASSTATFKIPYRPTTNVSCPVTPEGKGFGVNCDVGGYLATIDFKHFTPSGAVLPEKAIIEITNTPSDNPNDVVNVGEQTSYKEWDEALGPGYEGFIGEPPLNGGKPSTGSDPLPEDAYVRGALAEGGWTGYQPVLQVIAKP
jgi:hypothetical protein